MERELHDYRYDHFLVNGAGEVIWYYGPGELSDAAYLGQFYAVLLNDYTNAPFAWPHKIVRREVAPRPVNPGGPYAVPVPQPLPAPVYNGANFFNVPAPPTATPPVTPPQAQAQVDPNQPARNSTWRVCRDGAAGENGTARNAVREDNGRKKLGRPKGSKTKRGDSQPPRGPPPAGGSGAGAGAGSGTQSAPVQQQ
ncbi:hypothetical protein PRZ48_010634 [Zasmidium cellare]|uniref:Uncharacterized protein n=1 Tax=Zasmidium cellare TaxID=395010 RepID=A0ABR0E9M8_ZASCE|nr:hypothetical protein PRZ48_010634 [Zasmidium cellare]